MRETEREGGRVKGFSIKNINNNNNDKHQFANEKTFPECQIDYGGE